MPTTSTAANEWIPPGKNCGACGSATCTEFSARLSAGTANMTQCPFHVPSVQIRDAEIASAYSGRDIVGQTYDFAICPLPGEPSARKIVLPFRPDIVDRMEIAAGDIVTGRPTGAGCPVQHVIRVISVDYVTSVITGHVVGPSFSRGSDVKDVREYHMLGFEGRAVTVDKEPAFGMRQSFLPGFCMMGRAHTGLVNMVIAKPWGLHVRVEGIVIL
jgi:uncharacterized Fe-S cluster-containing protein